MKKLVIFILAFVIISACKKEETPKPITIIKECPRTVAVVDTITDTTSILKILFFDSPLEYSAFFAEKEFKDSTKIKFTNFYTFNSNHIVTRHRQHTLYITQYGKNAGTAQIKFLSDGTAFKVYNYNITSSDQDTITTAINFIIP